MIVPPSSPVSQASVWPSSSLRLARAVAAVSRWSVIRLRSSAVAVASL